MRSCSSCGMATSVARLVWEYHRKVKSWFIYCGMRKNHKQWN